METEILDRRQTTRGRSYLVRRGNRKDWMPQSTLRAEKWRSQIEAFDLVFDEEQQFEEHEEFEAPENTLQSAEEDSHLPVQAHRAEEEENYSGTEYPSNREEEEVDISGDDQ